VTHRATVLVVGVTARALGRSAIGAGYDVITVDGFGDRDLLEPLPRPRQHHTIQPFDPPLTVQYADSISADFVAYAANLENHPDVLARLARGRVLLGNAPAVLSAVRDAGRVSSALTAAGLPTAAVHASAPSGHDAAPALLVKPRRGGGGVGVRPWHGDAGVREDEFLQELVPGVSASLAFAADGKNVTPLALSLQLIGDSAFGAGGYRWCGNIVGPGVLPGDEVLRSAVAAATALTRAFELRGVNGIDFIVREDTAVVIEVNPRWTASMELAERARGASLFPTHVAACSGRLEPPGDPADGVFGKAVVYAPDRGVVGDTDGWLADPDVADVPASGSELPRGGPICTVFARGRDAQECRAALVDRAARVLRDAHLPRNQAG